MGRGLIYTLLIAWAVVCLFPIYWTVTTSFKMAPNVMQGALVPWVDYTPAWLGWRSLGLSPDTIGAESTVRDEFLKRAFQLDDLGALFLDDRRDPRVAWLPTACRASPTASCS